MSNRLIHEKSPYLLQHAENPVDWFPWCQEAFDKAVQDNKPVFLSIGYATCHWCHVMEHESFEDDEAAGVLNEAFVCIKVDREERPDIDAVYMAACQMATGSGGWPLTVIMTPERKPFFAGTYLPKRSRFGRPGLMEICDQIKTLWNTDPRRVMDAAENFAVSLGKAFEYPSGGGDNLTFALLDQAFRQLSDSYDPRYGGFDRAPKFPTPHRLVFLLRQHHRTGNSHALEMVTHTLTRMRQSGLWDHVGFGFHRYATDTRWLLPHFEKMLYDQALLAMAYVEAFQITGDQVYGQTAEEIFSYVLRDMTHPEGGFYTAEDADSEGEEGKFYVWRQEEFVRVADSVSPDIPWEKIFNLQPDGNFMDEATREKNGSNILHMTRSWEQWARRLEIPTPSLVDQWNRLRHQLTRRRNQRPFPLKDDKILTDWNGLMIAALAQAGRVLESDAYTTAAVEAVQFLESRLKDSQGRLLHRFRDGQAAIDAQATDYAFLTMGLIELYRTTFQADWLEKAIGLQKTMDTDFWDTTRAGYYQVSHQNKELPVRPKEIYDGAMPSINSVALSNLLLLSRLTGDHRWEERADRLARAFADTVSRQPLAFTHFLNGLDLALRPAQEVVVTGTRQAPDTRAILQVLHSTYAPHLVTHLKSDTNAGRLSELAAFTAGLPSAEGPATAHICTGFNCKNSTTDVDIMRKLLFNKIGETNTDIPEPEDRR